MKQEGVWFDLFYDSVVILRWDETIENIIEYLLTLSAK